MKILALNIGSSSIKCSVYAFTTLSNAPIDPLWVAHIRWKNGFEKATLKVKHQACAEHVEIVDERSLLPLLKHALHLLTQGKTALLNSFAEIDAIGHRIVYGGKFFHQAVVIDAEVKDTIRSLSELAPLHQSAELDAITLIEELFPGKPQVAVFDTAFHHTLPKPAAIYPGPYEWYKEDIQRFGFHGISFQYCSRRGAELLNRDLKTLKMLICHLGSGASLCAIQGGKSIDTTMGFTPLEGLMMDTRSGSIDPGIILYLLKKKHKTPEEIAHELYQESGLLGISGLSSNMQDMIEMSRAEQPRAVLAIELYLHRLNALIGSMIASLQGLDVLIFTGGIGENASFIREKVCVNFAFLGLQLDLTKNATSSRDVDLSAQDSRVKILLIHTQEGCEIARECLQLLQK